MSERLPGAGAVALAGAAAEAVRGLNHAAREPGGAGRPSAACHVPGSPSLAASRLGQALGQVTRHPGAALASVALGGNPGAARQQIACPNSSPRKDQP
jgi:hypothetical protein